MTAPDDDRQLMDRIVALDEAALRTLVARYHVRLHRYVARLTRNEAVAEEVINEVFHDAWRNARSFEGRSSAFTWLVSIAHNKSVSVLRKRREAEWDEEKASAIADDQDDPEVVTQKHDKGAQIRACMLELSPEHREIIDLVYYHEQSVGEVAAALAIPEATVKTRMFYARKRLGELLKARGIDRGWP
jgi:RNA polymerase sigma-70 factor (ECF subfamily)